MHAAPQDPALARTPRRPIRALSALVANQIAAGEVVERPASVVKELVENALDAGATRVVIELEQGGVELIRVSDDGCGITPDDLPLAIAPHATSKIEHAGDLDHIATLGFRGEALASIASVSRVSIRSRTSDAPGASLLEIEGTSQQPIRPAAGPVGTCVTVRNLFFNTPARRKFLRTPQTEKERCADVVDQLALAHPGVGVALLIDGRSVLDLPSGQTPRQRVLAVLGREIEGQMIDVHADQFDDARGIALWGLAGLPSVARGSVKGQHVFVNGRPVRDRTIQHAISEAYRGLIEPGRYPTLVLMLELSPQGVDVNVHPQKAEVRFRDGSMVHATVLRALRDGLAKADLTPSIAALRPVAWAPTLGKQQGLLGATSRAPLGLSSELDARGASMGTVSEAKFADYFSRFRPGKDQLALTLAAGDQAARVGQQIQTDQSPAADVRHGALPNATTSDAPPMEDAGREPTAEARAIGSSAAAMLPLPADRLLQVHNSYVITQDSEGVVIIDQHALHERVMFEYLTHRVLAGNLESQHLLMPVVVQASPAQLALLDELAPLLTRIGCEVHPLSPTTLGVQAFPSFLLERNVEVGPFLEEVLAKAEAGELTGLGSQLAKSPSSFRVDAAGAEHALRDVLDMMACKAAVKAGDRLSDIELAELIKLREDVERSSNCPHGRPTSIRLTMRELARLFGRS